MYAVIEAGGRQWKVEPGTRFEINRVAGEVGVQHTIERVLLAHDGSALHIGRPYVPGAKVICEVLAVSLGPKVISYHYRRRENWRRTLGHRQPLTKLVVKEILCNGKSDITVSHEAKVSALGALPSTPRTKTTGKKSAVKRATTASTVQATKKTAKSKKPTK